MFRGRLMRSAMVLISLKALSMARSELLMVRRFWYLELPNSSKLAAPVPCGGKGGCFQLTAELHDDKAFFYYHLVQKSFVMKTTLCTLCTLYIWTWTGFLFYITLPIMVVRSPPLSRGFWASPTLDGSFRAFSLEKVLHSEPTSITRSPEEIQGIKTFGEALSSGLKREELQGTGYEIHSGWWLVNMRASWPDRDTNMSL